MIPNLGLEEIVTQRFAGVAMQVSDRTNRSLSSLLSCGKHIASQLEEQQGSNIAAVVGPHILHHAV